MAKLTKTFIDKVAPPAKGYAIHWDEALKGYGLRVSAPSEQYPSGKRVFMVQGRVRGKAVAFTIGPFGEWTEFEARERARKVLQAMREGIDPRDVKKADEAARVTLRDVADAYLRDRPLKESSKGEIERHVVTTFSTWQQRPLKDITREDVGKRFNDVRANGTTGKGAAPAQANQAFAVLRALFNYAMREYRKPDGTPVFAHNPVDVLYKKWTPLRARTSRVPESKIGALWSSLQQWREVAYNRDTLASIDLVMFLLLTGARIGEASALTWDRVNLDEGWWHLPDPKNRNPVWLPLSSQAVQLLTTRQRVKGSPFVFSSWGKCGHIKDPRDTMKKVSEVAGTKITPHDLRRTFTTFGVANCGVDLHKIELLTNHVPRGVTAKHYLETSHLQYLRPEVQRIADWIESEARKLSSSCPASAAKLVTTNA